MDNYMPISSEVTISTKGIEAIFRHPDATGFDIFYSKGDGKELMKKSVTVRGKSSKKKPSRQLCTRAWNSVIKELERESKDFLKLNGVFCVKASKDITFVEKSAEDRMLIITYRDGTEIKVDFKTLQSLAAAFKLVNVKLLNDADSGCKKADEP